MMFDSTVRAFLPKKNTKDTSWTSTRADLVGGLLVLLTVLSRMCVLCVYIQAKREGASQVLARIPKNSCKQTYRLNHFLTMEGRRSINSTLVTAIVCKSINTGKHGKFFFTAF